MSQDPYYNDPPAGTEPTLRDFAKWLIAPAAVAIVAAYLFF